MNLQAEKPVIPIMFEKVRSWITVLHFTRTTLFISLKFDIMALVWDHFQKL